MDRFPIFNTGRILKVEMLEELRDYPRDILNVYLNDYSDGIIAGIDLLSGEQAVTVTRGLVKCNGRTHIIAQDIRLPWPVDGGAAMIKMKFSAEETQEDFRIRRVRLLIDDTCALGPDELELGRFTLAPGARLRAEYRDLYDLSTEHNTLNIINAPYADAGESTLHPRILKYFARAAFQHRSDDPCDAAFVMHCLNQTRVSRELITRYVARRRGIDVRAYTNMALYEHLCGILKEMEANDQRPAGPREVPATLITVE